jgi:hypothetical protein
MIPGERLPPHRGDLAELVHPDPLPQHPADMFVRNTWVDQDRQDHIHQ